jgi:hypothetical protein
MDQDQRKTCRHSGAIASFIGDGTRNPFRSARMTEKNQNGFGFRRNDGQKTSDL